MPPALALRAAMSVRESASSRRSWRFRFIHNDDFLLARTLPLAGMEIEYQLTFDDFREAVVSFSRAQMGGRRQLSTGRGVRGILGWMVFLPGAGLFFRLLNRPGPAPKTPGWVLAREGLLALPWVALVLLLIGIATGTR